MAGAPKDQNWVDRVIRSMSPGWAARRAQARLLLRNYEAASTGRRTSGWARNNGDADSVMRVALPELRRHARDLERNNSWAKRALNVIGNNTVGWGIVPKAVDDPTADLVWKTWAERTECDSEGLLTFAGIQRLAMKTIAKDGEVLIRRRWRRPEDKLSIPVQIQILEGDYIDINRDRTLPNGGEIVQGVEFDALGRRVAYWLFPNHPGSALSVGESRRVLASEILHVFDVERPSASRGVSWLASAIVNIKDLDEYEDGELLKQKIAACFTAFVKDSDGSAGYIGEEDTSDDSLETVGPGAVSYLAPGKDVVFGNPPTVQEGSFAARTLRKFCAGLGVPYEEVTGDYSNFNFSSARMSKVTHYENVKHWRYNMLIPLLCDGVWGWAMEAAVLAGKVRKPVLAEWTAPPMAMIEPDKEGLAISRLVRNGVMTPSDVVREQGGDPVTFFERYAADMKKLDALGIQLDSDVRAVSQAGLTQVRVGAGGGDGGKPPAAAGDKAPAKRSDDEIDADLERLVLEIERRAFEVKS
jgi:lambda family phage portal protein